VALGETDEHDEAAVAFNQRRDCAGPAAVQQAPFPMAWYGPIFDVRWAFTDVEHRWDVTLAGAIRLTSGSAGAVSQPQIAGQFLAEGSTGLHEQRRVDRLARHAHLRIIRKLES
jgi:hypothetical protein